MTRKLSRFALVNLENLLTKHGIVDMMFRHTLTNYVVYGISPYSYDRPEFLRCKFITDVLANDMFAVRRLAKWRTIIGEVHNLFNFVADLPKEMHGSYEKIDVWCTQSDKYRMRVLEKHKLLLTEKEEIVYALKYKRDYDRLVESW